CDAIRRLHSCGPRDDAWRPRVAPQKIRVWGARPLPARPLSSAPSGPAVTLRRDPSSPLLRATSWCVAAASGSPEDTALGAAPPPRPPLIVCAEPAMLPLPHRERAGVRVGRRLSAGCA